MIFIMRCDWTRDCLNALRQPAGANWLVRLFSRISANGFPLHRQDSDFNRQRLHVWVIQLMQAYQRTTGIHLSSHDFRRAALTRAAEKNVHPKRAAVAFVVTPEMMMKYWTATEKKQSADEMLGDRADDRLPKRKEGKRGRKQAHNSVEPYQKLAGALVPELLNSQ